MNEFEKTYSQSEVKTLNAYINDTFKWLMIGVAVTFVTAFTVEKSHIMNQLYDHSLLPVVMLLVEFGIAMYFSLKLFKMNPVTAKLLFIVYAFFTGLSFSLIISFYTAASVAMAFLVSAVFFGVLVLVGSYTRIDLTRIGNICCIGLIVYIVYALLAMVFGWSQFLLPFIALALFTGITAYDMQKTIHFYFQFQSDEMMIKRLSIFSAFNLYLDFINIFIQLLRIFGDNE